jgi:NDP-sugar pyrophosphorylase family protein|tara:strand:- start:545 stop:1321 length:777 start_codon:yes stop_codon:yes gene_type:complete
MEALWDGRPVIKSFLTTLKPCGWSEDHLFCGVMRADELFTYPEGMPFSEFFLPDAAPWDWVGCIKKALAGLNVEVGSGPEIPPGVHIEGAVHLDPTVKLPAYATLIGPAWIGPEVEIRPGAFVRGHVIVGRGSVLGNACEYKNCLLLEDVETPHYNYVGDSVLGNRAHLGAGAICANLKLARDEVSVELPSGKRQQTGMRKLGGLLGDGAEASCNCVLQPGTVLGRGSAVLAPSFSGYLAEQKIIHARFETLVTSRPT